MKGHLVKMVLLKLELAFVRRLSVSVVMASLVSLVTPCILGNPMVVYWIVEEQRGVIRVQFRIHSVCGVTGSL